MLKVWIARDSDGSLWFSLTIPSRESTSRWHAKGGMLRFPNQDDPLGNGVTGESEPKELNLVEEEQVEALREELEKYKRALGKMAIDTHKHSDRPLSDVLEYYLTQAEQELENGKLAISTETIFASSDKN